MLNEFLLKLLLSQLATYTFDRCSRSLPEYFQFFLSGFQLAIVYKKKGGSSDCDDRFKNAGQDASGTDVLFITRTIKNAAATAPTKITSSGFVLQLELADSATVNVWVLWW